MSVYWKIYMYDKTFTAPAKGGNCKAVLRKRHGCITGVQLIRNGVVTVSEEVEIFLIKGDVLTLLVESGGDAQKCTMQ